MEKKFEFNINNNPENKNNNPKNSEERMKPISELIIEEMARIIKGMNKEEAEERIGEDNYDRVQKYIEGKKEKEKENKKTQEEPDEDKAESQKSKEEAELQDALGRNRKDINDLYNR